MTKDEALKIAIEALEEAREQLGGLPQLEKLIQDCKEALEQKEYDEKTTT
jgi:20S proteasome alpha/beta subunit